ncbi:hypothetical protein E1B28_008017 [Marasmius oreades]|uniref:Uncharacterized protein n=1 Tax=Marasmius oreades TaxID=181124 RepID=A0A9P7S3G9_9AGAR|nr:uncharacterized protein E1B28_008017 [Marasmius oreades]KAG7094417.1 hypothetical protein E1B28_008017 [Marasmius oreades]
MSSLTSSSSSWSHIPSPSFTHVLSSFVVSQGCSDQRGPFFLCVAVIPLSVSSSFSRDIPSPPVLSSFRSRFPCSDLFPSCFRLVFHPVYSLEHSISETVLTRFPQASTFILSLLGVSCPFLREFHPFICDSGL